MYTILSHVVKWIIILATCFTISLSQSATIRQVDDNSIIFDNSTEQSNNCTLINFSPSEDDETPVKVTVYDQSVHQETQRKSRLYVTIFVSSFLISSFVSLTSLALSIYNTVQDTS